MTAGGMEQAPDVDYEALRQQYAEQKREEQHDEEGDTIVVTLNMPDGSTRSLKVKAGHQVEYLKAWLSEQPDAPKDGTYRLLLDGKEMIDPLSFMDYATIEETGKATITVALKEQEPDM